MHVDIEGATRIDRLAAEFDWTWVVDDLEPFCSQAGWELVELREGGGSIRTDFPVSRPRANMYGRNRSMDTISIFVSDLADDATPMTVLRPLLDEGFTNLDVALTALLGTAPSAEPGPPAALRWDLPKVVVRLSMSPSAIHLRLTSPGYQAWMDEPEPEYEDKRSRSARSHPVPKSTLTAGIGKELRWDLPNVRLGRTVRQLGDHPPTTVTIHSYFSAPATVAAMQRAYFWFSRPAPGGSVGVTTR
ncbi:conserved hypothetical protein [Rhodococcus sp. RD6.2]|uniref:DUF6301 family protein n=1 Tax=Rhodococcus sp. RD6.2 TaxID=260936 RepID=UPI00063B68F0|nr:DUF6301 family protein [Rhodococcus sp. RD6.2]CRK53576.1 conserved hypothetical protein [Rhodococcus sp. RD6.2]